MRTFPRLVLIWLLCWSLGLQAAGIAAGGCELPAHPRGEASVALDAARAPGPSGAHAAPSGHVADRGQDLQDLGTGGVACVTVGTTCASCGFPVLPTFAVRPELRQHHGFLLAAPAADVTLPGILRPPREYA